MQNSYSEIELSSIDSTPSDSFQLPNSDINSDYYTPELTNSFTTPDSLEQSEKRHNPYNIASSISMRSVSSNVTNENVSKRPSSLPVFRQNGKKTFLYLLKSHSFITCCCYVCRLFCLWS